MQICLDKYIKIELGCFYLEMAHISLTLSLMALSGYTITDQPERFLQEVINQEHLSKAMVLVDENTNKFCLPKMPLLQELSSIEIPAGEEHKNLETCAEIWRKMTEAGLDRHALLINLGGGVVGDMGGFCASTYKRGISFINLPTTLLSQVDASVGGKLGVDFNGLKNHIGVFQDPETVIIYPEFLKTLDPMEVRSGFAEVIKHGLIASSDHYQRVRNIDLSRTDWTPIIAESVKIKESVVDKDPRERGLRKILNFGHTLGHAVETYYLNQENRLLHGEAIAIGMICEAWLSRKKCTLSSGNLETVVSDILNFFPKREVLPQVDKDCLSLLHQDKKNVADQIMCTLLASIGKAEWDIEISVAEASQAIDFYNNL